MADRQLDVLVICGSLRKGSYNAALARMLPGLAPPGRDLLYVLAPAPNLAAGSVWVNCYQAMDPAVPFGGYKMSGYGRESGKQHVEEYLNVKAVWIKTA